MPYDTAPIIVEIDKDLEDLIPGYLANRKAELASLKTMAEALQFQDLRNIGHKMKGTAGGYGFAKLSEIGKTIETASDAKDITTIREALKAMEDYLANVQVQFVSNG